MKPTLLISGDRANFSTLTLDLEKTELRLVANYPAPENASWVEPASSHGDVDCLIGLSEGEDSGLLYTFEIDHAQKTCKITSQQPTLGAPGHFATLRDQSALAIITYLGGSAALYPTSVTKEARLLLTDAPRTEIQPDFPYKSILEDRQGLLYAPDLGGDRVWIFCRNGMKLGQCGWLQCPPGTGPRHASFSPDEKIMYVIGELSHTVLAFDLSTSPTNNIQPIPGFEPNVIPPSVQPHHQVMMDSSELYVHPRIPNVLYISNRWERHIAERQPYLKDVPLELPPGDAIAIILLSDDGRRVQDIQHVRTNLDTIRGMRLSDDGKYMAVCGQEGGGVEVYGIGGDRGEVWTLVASLNEGLESGIKHVVWL